MCAAGKPAARDSPTRKSCQPMSMTTMFDWNVPMWTSSATGRTVQGWAGDSMPGNLIIYMFFVFFLQLKSSVKEGPNPLFHDC